MTAAFSDVREKANSVVAVSRCDPCTVAAHRPGAACNHPDCDLRGRPAPKTGATLPSPRARVAPVPNHVRPPVHAQRDTETKERNHVC